MNVVDETLTMVEESMETSFDMMDMLGQNVTDDMKQQMRDSIEMIPMMIPKMIPKIMIHMGQIMKQHLLQTKDAIL